MRPLTVRTQVNQILRKRLSFATNRWSIELVKKRESWGSDDESESEPKFTDFLSFLKRMTLIATERNTILGPKKLKEKSVEINAIDAVGGAAQGGTASHRGGRGGGGNRGSGARGGRGGGRGGGTNHVANTTTTATSQSANQSRGGVGGKGFRGGGSGGTVTRGQTSSKPINKSQAQKTPSASTAVSGGNGSKNVSTTWACVACHGHVFHQLESCSTFAQKAGSERFLILKTAGFCCLCLRRGHIAPQCESSKKCSKCEGRHHDLLHRENATAAPSSENKN